MPIVQGTNTMKMVWSFQCVLLSWSLVVFFLPSFSTGQACTTKGWFGTNCQYKCHCTNDNCNFTTGECLDSSVCVQGWFGPQCQYVDLITAFHNSNNPMWLYDGDDSTCNNDTTLQTLTVQLTGPEPFTWIIPFTWLRLHVRNKDELTTIEVQFKSDSSPDLYNLVDCNNKRTAGVGNNSLDIHCDLDIYVQQVILTGQGVRSLCSVYFNGGRLVTLRQNTAQSTTSNFKFASKAVDGIDSYEDCSSTQREQNPHWTVTFSNPQAMNKLSVNYLETPFSTYTVTWYHYLSKLQKRTLYSPKNGISNATYMSTAIHPVAPVTSITISFTVPETQRLELCEVAAYGDTVCPQGKYGRECEHSCDNCFNQTCFVSTGGCPDGCIDGYMGDQCETPCQPNTYGQDCLQTCSTNCVRNETLTDQVCHHVDGSCILGCKDGFIGPLCEDRGQGEDSFPISAVVGAVAAVVLIIAVIVAVLLWRRRKRNKDDKSIYMNENTPAAADTNNRTSTE